LYPDSWAAARISERYDIPHYAKVLGTDVNRLIRGEATSEKARDAIINSRKIICVSRSLQDALIAFGADPDKLAVIYNGVHREIFFPMDKGELRRSFGIPESVKIVLYVGNVIREKGLKELVRAYSEVRKSVFPVKTRLYLIGTGPFQPDLEKLMIACGINEYRTFLGALPHSEVAKWMNVADVLCLPSYSEGLPNVVNEALACGTTVVATSVGGIPELFVERGSLFLVPPRDATTLANSLEKALFHIPDRGTVHPLFSWEENAESTRRLISEVAG
jgi:glycosyltransferase involved in cell wall biosynthesis